jgi:hypothetical protein
MRALILEDNRDRRVAMIGRLAERFPFLRVDFFDASEAMIQGMQSDDLQDVAIISLDHDLELLPGLQGDWIDPGTGLDVARWLSERTKPICPVVVHTTNLRAGERMTRLLENSHWVTRRVIPHDDLGWIESDWFRVIRNAIVGFAPRHRSTPVQKLDNKVSLVRALLDSQSDSGQAFCNEAVTRITEAYLRDLRKILHDASVEVISLVNGGVLASVFDSEGRVAQWCREMGIPQGTIFEWAERGPLAPAQLDVGADAAQQLIQSGVQQFQVRIIEATDMQALIVVASSHALTTTAIQALLMEFKDALEIALFISLRWQPPANKPELTRSQRAG